MTFIQTPKKRFQWMRILEDLWVRFPMSEILKEHLSSLKKEPPIPPGTQILTGPNISSFEMARVVLVFLLLTANSVCWADETRKIS